MDLLINDFKGFLEKENLTQLDKSTFNGSVDEFNDYYWDKSTDFYFYHDFDATIPFDESYSLVKEKYQRRIKRLYKQIQSAQDILIVWWSRDKHQDIDKVKQSHAILSQKFPSKTISILLVEFSTESNQNIYNLNGGGQIMLLQYDNISYKHNPNYNETMGNEANNNAVFEKIKRKKKPKDYCKQIVFYMVKFVINLIPFKKARHKLRTKWKFYFFRDKL